MQARYFLFLVPFAVVSEGLFVAVKMFWLCSEAFAGVLSCLASTPPPCAQAALAVFAYFVDMAFWTSGDTVAGLGTVDVLYTGSMMN